MTFGTIAAACNHTNYTTPSFAVVVWYPTNVRTASATANDCPYCGRSLYNHYEDRTNHTFTSFVQSKHRPRHLAWFRRVVKRWRPYRRRVTYSAFIRPRQQNPRPRCRDPPS